jgi:hypothetical protein
MADKRGWIHFRSDTPLEDLLDAYIQQQAQAGITILSRSTACRTLLYSALQSAPLKQANIEVMRIIAGALRSSTQRILAQMQEVMPTVVEEELYKRGVEGD